MADLSAGRDGACRIQDHEGEDGRFLEAHFLSDNASGLVNTIRLAMMNDINVDTLYQQSIMGPYPTGESDLIYMLKPLFDR